MFPKDNKRIPNSNKKCYAKKIKIVKQFCNENNIRVSASTRVNNDTITFYAYPKPKKEPEMVVLDSIAVMSQPANQPNRNGRVYSKEAFKKLTQNFNQQMANALGVPASFLNPPDSSFSFKKDETKVTEFKLTRASFSKKDDIIQLCKMKLFDLILDNELGVEDNG